MAMRVPFEKIGISPDIGEHTVDVIEQLLAERPNSSVDIQRVSAETGHASTVVKEIFYALLAFGALKATFLPRHRVCGNIIGKQEQSSELVRERARAGQYACMHCFEEVESPEDVEIQIVFWEPGANTG
jgi:hypothetical protein